MCGYHPAHSQYPSGADREPPSWSYKTSEWEVGTGEEGEFKTSEWGSGMGREDESNNMLIVEGDIRLGVILSVRGQDEMKPCGDRLRETGKYQGPPPGHRLISGTASGRQVIIRDLLRETGKYQVPLMRDR